MSDESAQPKAATQQPAERSTTRRHHTALVVACGLAGALAVPLHPVNTLLSAALFAALGFAGARLWRTSGLESPAPEHPDVGSALRGWMTAFAVGVLLGLVLLAAIRLVIQPMMPSIGTRMAVAGSLPVWKRVVIVYVAAVGEEAVFRLFLMSLVSAVAVRASKRMPRLATPGIFWFANGLSAIAFAAVHLPSWAVVTHLDFWLAGAVLALNMVGGLVFGYVFGTRGIVPAMWTHAGADCVVQFLGPLVG
jgi:membrane protease YdiL (CAAX protease family)